MIIHNVVQGSPEWHALRANFQTASEAPAMMGESKQIKRTDLLNAKKTGLARDLPQIRQVLSAYGERSCSLVIAALAEA